MTPNKRDLKAYSRFDGTGRIVPGSTVLRRNKPKVGNWIEVQAYECCDTAGCNFPPVPLTASGFTNTPLSSGCTPIIVIKCNEIDILYLTAAFPAGDSMQNFFNLISNVYSWLGTWSLDGEVGTLELNGNIAKQMCPDGILTMQAYTGCPG